MAVTNEAPAPASAMVRAFIAVTVPAAAPMLESLRSDPELATLPVRWLAMEGLHITVAFLGECEMRDLAEVWPLVSRTVRAARPFSLALEAPTLFPEPARPRLVVAPVRDSRGALQALHGGVVAALAESGFPPDARDFRAHVSLGRLRPPLLRGQAAAVGAALRARAWEGMGSFDAVSVNLMRSDLFPDGARYTSLAEAPLGGR